MKSDPPRRGFDPDLFADPAPTERRVRLAADNARLLEAEREARARAEQAAARTARLQAITASLAETLTRDEVADAVLRESLPAMGARGGCVAILDDAGALVTLKQGDLEPPAADDAHLDPASLPWYEPMHEAVRTGALVLVGSPDTAPARFGALATLAQGRGIASFAVVPLLSGRRAIGVLTLGFPETRAFDAEDRDFMVALGRQCALALERARLYLESQTARAAAEASERRQRFLADASRALGSSLDVEAALARVAQLAVPELADGCAIDLVDDDRLRSVAIALRDSGAWAHATEQAARHPPLLDGDDERAEVVRTGRPFGSSEAPRAPREARGAVRALGLGSYVVLPLVARDRTFGTITFGHAAEGRSYADADVPFFEEVARRAAMAVDNARLYREAERVNRAKDEFLATLSHELRNPLNAMLGWTRMLRTGNLDEAMRERALQTIERNVQAQVQLIEDLLDVSRIITGKMRLRIAPCDLEAIVTAAIDTLRPAADARGLTLTCAFDPRVTAANGDADRLQQVVWNLLSNAIKFTSVGGRIDLGVARTVDAIEIRVTDDGRGIPASFLPHVFDRFRQADASTTRAHAGLGLGLAITRHLVELHGGTIHAESEGEGRGATFRVRLPLRAAPAETPPIERKRASDTDLGDANADSLAGIDVLAVDDDGDARELLAMALGRHGAHVRVAGSVREALRAIEDRVPDVLVSDIGMPDEDGYDLIRQVRALPPSRGGTVPAAALTAYAHADDVRRVIAAGFALHLAKPVEPGALVTALRKLAASV